MINWIVTQAMQQRALVMLATLILIGIGLWSAVHLPVDAVPDITHVQVQVNTPVSALAPEEIENLVTFPIETEMAGLPGMTDLRSLSKYGLSQVTMVFEDGADIYLLRQLVAERLQSVKEEIPEGLSPQLAPIATGLGEIFYYAIHYTDEAEGLPESPKERLMALKIIHDLTVKPLLRATPGITEINTTGGYEKQIVIQPYPERLTAVGMTLEDVAEKISMNTENVGGGLI
ncbi:MAG: efflux RND transporter permease subunit, partial [Verrucomicrobiota bacterium]